MQYGVTLCGSFMRKECRNKWEGNHGYVKEFGSKGEVTQRVWLRTVSAGHLGDKERCGMCMEGKCEQCHEGDLKIL